VKPSPNTRPVDPVSPDGPGDEDRNLALRAGKGDAAAFGALYDRYAEAVYRYVFYRVRNDADAEDLVSDVFMRALRAIPRYEPRVAFLAWLYRIARNAVIDRARRSRTQISFEDALAHPGADHIVEPDATILALSDKEAVRGALAKLTPLQQEVIVLRFVEGYSTLEIANLVGKREGTVRGIQFRALEALRALIPSREALA
jgi:RNA polymerase sigma-70 factor, ECF subfamily